MRGDERNMKGNGKASAGVTAAKEGVGLLLSK